MKKNPFLYLVVLFCFLFAPVRSAFPLRTETVKLLKHQLNSDRIKYFFGSFGVELLNLQSSEFPESRISNLYSMHDDKKVMRTLALVDFKQTTHPLLQEAHREIINGGSIGATLSRHGWKIKKNPMYFGSFYLTSKILQWMQEEQLKEAAIHIYRLEVYQDNQTPIPYCTILEIHSPQYLTVEWLQALYVEQWDIFTEETEEVSILLDRLSRWIGNISKTDELRTM